MIDKAVADFIYSEADILDSMQWEKWIDLFDQDARYWVPLEWKQHDPILQPSLMYEDILLLRVRVERLAGTRTFSQKPKSRCHHLLQAPRIVAEKNERSLIETKTSFLYTETRGDKIERFSGWATHYLKAQGDGFKIMLKRIDLINFDAPFSNIQLFI